MQSMLEKLPLSQREKEVAKLVAQGYSNAEISSLLDISVNTVKFHNKNIFDKLGIDSRMKLLFMLNSKPGRRDKTL